MSQQDIELREKFLFTLDWLLAVTKRYSTDVKFNLAHVNFANPQLLGDMYGAQEAAQKLNEILHCLSRAFRKTDLIARDGVDFWVLAPYTPSDDNFIDKIKTVIDIASQGGLQIVDRDISIFSLPFESHELAQDYSATEFLSYLKKNHLRLACREVSLPPVRHFDDFALQWCNG